MAVSRSNPKPVIRPVTTDEVVDRMQRTFDAVARRAFAIFEGNGRRFGHELEDWLQAESELLHPVHLDIYEANGSLIVRAEVPGFRLQDLEIDLEPRRLTISGTRETRDQHQRGKALYSEHCSNEIFRAIDLPAEIDLSNKAAKATYDQGVLTITLPKRHDTNTGAS
jgi:HSP20 family protein